MIASPTLEHISIRRVTIADEDKVRYRVYTSPVEFVAVIAESALMAIKVSGIRQPHKIVRDLPTAGVAMDADRLSKMEELSERVALAIEKTEGLEKRVADLLPREEAEAGIPFQPMTLNDLQSQDQVRPRILSAQMLSEIIDEHSKHFIDAVAPVIVEASPVQPVVAEVPAKPLEQKPKLSPEEVQRLLNE